MLKTVDYQIRIVLHCVIFHPIDHVIGHVPKNEQNEPMFKSKDFSTNNFVTLICHLCLTVFSSAFPINGFMIINRLHLNDLIEPINKNLEFQLQDPFLLYRNGRGTFTFFKFCFFYINFHSSTVQ